MLNKYQGKRICVAVSGGADSVALLHYLNALKDEKGYSLCAVHCEHGIRGEESVEDMRFVKRLCDQWGVELFVFLGDCPTRARQEKESLETAARNFRYECFRSLIDEGKADFIATAHHKNDEAETVLFRLARGTSLGGMSAMKAENGYLLRPILEWTKAEIADYIEKNGYQLRITRDKDTAYTLLKAIGIPQKYAGYVTSEDNLIGNLADLGVIHLFGINVDQINGKR